MDKIFRYIADTFPGVGEDNFYSLLIFLLMVFGSLYVIFKIIFFLGDNKRAKKEKPKKEEKKPELVKKEEEKPKEEKVVVKQEKIKVIKEKPVKEKKVKPKEEEIKITYLEEPKSEVAPVDAYYSHDNHNSYVVSSYNVPDRKMPYGENYLHDYYNDGKTFNNIEPKREERVESYNISSSAKDRIEMAKKSDDIVRTYNSLPTELKRYILEKILSSK